MSSSSRPHEKKRPEDVTLPPISQIFNVSSGSSNSQMALPPLRGNREGHPHASHHSSSIREHGPPAGYPGYPSGVPNPEDSQAKRARYDSSRSHSYAHPSAINRAASSHSAHNPHEVYPPSVSARYQPSGMTMPEASSSMHPSGRTDVRYVAPTHPGYGPSPYSYVPPPAHHAHPTAYATSRGPSHASYAEDPRSGTSRTHESSRIPSNPASTGQGYHTEEHSTAKAAKYECSYCGKGFLRPSALKIHIISHTGDKDYVCPEESCGRRFGVRSNMLRHIRLVHQGNHSHSSGEEGSKDEWSE
ncbi:hypothetical protein GYMLUDRAFT_238768 [Collybiopsis luxurians FD-317 M1]|nr:hypothetical protein GYMLUDRAFT_238768 [Collybiopsis luxurians FD-317 M1]